MDLHFTAKSELLACSESNVWMIENGSTVASKVELPFEDPKSIRGVCVDLSGKIWVSTDDNQVLAYEKYEHVFVL